MSRSLDPILHRLSADSSFLLQLPRPVTETHEVGRSFFNILIDPWLLGSQTDYSPLVSRQWHRERPAVESIPEVVALIDQIEARSQLSSQGNQPRASSRGDGLGSVDAVFILHEFTDHMHQSTLEGLHPEIPIFATAIAATNIHGWNHFKRIAVIQDFPTKLGNWHDLSCAPLPSWLSVSRLSQKDVGYIHSALLITFVSFPSPTQSTANASPQTSASTATQHANAIIYTPHGIPPSAATPLRTVTPAVKPICLIHGLDNVTMGLLQLNLGVKNALELQKEIKADYWVPCHDERKLRGGLIGLLLKQEEGIIEDYDKEEVVGVVEDEVHDKKVEGNVGFVALKNGEQLVLA